MKWLCALHKLTVGYIHGSSHWLRVKERGEDTKAHLNSNYDKVKSQGLELIVPGYMREQAGPEGWELEGGPLAWKGEEGHSVIASGCAEVWIPITGKMDCFPLYRPYCKMPKWSPLTTPSTMKRNTNSSEE